jgi:hypothetical protein
MVKINKGKNIMNEKDDYCPNCNNELKSKESINGEYLFCDICFDFFDKQVKENVKKAS